MKIQRLIIYELLDFIVQIDRTKNSERKNVYKNL